MDRVFGAIASGTFALQLISLLILLGAGLVFLLITTGIWGATASNTDLLIFFLLLGGGAAFLIFIWLLGFFLRFHQRVRRFIIGSGVGRVESGSPAATTILILFGGAILFIFCAGIYGYYLVWKYILKPWGDGFLASYGMGGNLFYELGLTAVYIALGTIIICLIAQLLSAAINRYAGRLITSLGK